MNRSYSKIRHIQEANLKLEKRLLNEDNADMYIKRRLFEIEKLIDKFINMVEEEEYSFSDEYEFASNIISWVIDELRESDNKEYDYDELKNSIKDNFGEYILSQYTESDFDDEDDF